MRAWIRACKGAGMGKLQRPATLKEFVIQSLLGRREPEPTLVDRDDEAPTALLRRAESSAPPPAAPRDTLASYVFDLGVVPRVASSPSHSEILRDTLPAPPPVDVRPRAVRPAASRTRRHARPRTVEPAPAPTRGGGVARVILLALLVLAALASAGNRQVSGLGAGAIHALPHGR